MKHKIYYILAVMGLMTAMFLASCEKDEMKTLPAEWHSVGVGTVTAHTAEINGFVVAGEYSEYGACYSESENPTTSDQKVTTEPGDKALFVAILTDLKHVTKYYARAYVVKDGETTYGEQVTFTTLPIPPTVETVDISALRADGVTSGGEITDNGGAAVSAKGICWGTSSNPTVDDNSTNDGKDSEAYASLIAGLDSETKYYLRAYATNSAGTAYGQEISFTTVAAEKPTVVTSEATNVTATGASVMGTITHDGLASILDKGICWSTSENPTFADTIISAGAGIDAFTANINGLDINTTYYVRTFAVNAADTAYGEQITFTTLNESEWYLPGNHQGWNPETAPTVYSLPDNPQTLTGYVWLDGEFKFTANRDWTVNYGDEGGDGTLDANGSNISVPSAGMYRVTVNLAEMTYKVEAANWGVIGDATPGGWATDSDMEYSAANNALYVALDLTANQFKFRANDDWGLNYGDNGLDGTLEEGGENIPVAAAGAYVIKLDLSTPNNYTYSVSSWGIIGNATPGGWDADTDMVVDGNKLVLTTDLTAGEIKFRANDDWAVNYGDDGADMSLEAGGANIVIDEAGNYTITLDLVNNSYTLVKN